MAVIHQRGSDDRSIYRHQSEMRNEVSTNRNYYHSLNSILDIFDSAWKSMEVSRFP